MHIIHTQVEGAQMLYHLVILSQVSRKGHHSWEGIIDWHTNWVVTPAEGTQQEAINFVLLLQLGVSCLMVKLMIQAFYAPRMYIPFS